MEPKYNYIYTGDEKKNRDDEEKAFEKISEHFKSMLKALIKEGEKDHNIMIMDAAIGQTGLIHLEPGQKEFPIPKFAQIQLSLIRDENQWIEPGIIRKYKFKKTFKPTAEA